MEIPGGGGSTVSPLEWKILQGGGSNWTPPPPPQGGMDIFWNHTFSISKCFVLIRFNSKVKSKRFTESKLCIIN